MGNLTLPTEDDSQLYARSALKILISAAPRSLIVSAVNEHRWGVSETRLKKLLEKPAPLTARPKDQKVKAERNLSSHQRTGRTAETQG
ncbi:uncharacterized protein N7515_000504 [Penicillium bovifimosum]|uniref:Uncharacterized protein n=1 Tax=Penicillium bovifimosum TaxID=126998 RepID=A0A9W9HFI0_9EURO|nr:uncharacterized protein N7515_000504 [Penicillium bovifimosum]KAJ5145940.1 hypothetical protein N7515_000504 [Penicillium bovifimosum]